MPKLDTDPEARTVSSGSLPVAVRATSPEAAHVVLAQRYELLGMLGAGAMGTVYRARDRELDEIVALKVLKQELASAEMIERFRREVKLARRVTHRNVARTYDIGEHEGDRFLTMEFVEGEMLGTRLARHGRLDLGEAQRLAIDVCAGLGAAHAAGVLHRDLKPENVIVAKDGRAVITDFGIARAVAEGEISRTQGGIVGTPAYMAPEQVEGATDLDARADLYALGTMLYELLTGVMAWQGDSIVTVAAGRLLRPPPDVRSIVPTLPASAAEVVLKLMARRREDRFASAEEASAALATGFAAGGSAAAPVSGTSPTLLGVMPSAPPAPSLPSILGRSAKTIAAGGKSVAVLPILNLGAADDAHLAFGVNEDVIDLLSMVPGLFVRPRGETARHVEPTRDVRSIGQSLGVDVVVDGSVRRIGDAVRASFRLITVEDGFQLWARRFDRGPAEVLSIADDAAHAIATALTAELTTPVKERSADAEAEELYLRGRYLLRRAWHAGPREATDVLARAAERAPHDPRILGAQALALARCYGLESYGREVAERARSAAGRSLERDPKQPEAMCALATIHLQNGETESAALHLRSALKVAPNCLDALDWLGRIMAEVGRIEEGVALLERVESIDPDYAAARLQIARIRGMHLDRAGMLAVLGPVPPHPSDLAGWFLMQCRHALWHRDRATAVLLTAQLAKLELPPAAHVPVSALLEVAAGHGHRLAERALVDRMLPIDGTRAPRRAAFNAQMRAELFASVGDQARTLEALRAADANAFFDAVFLAQCPLLDSIRSNAEFVVLRQSVNLRAARIAEAIGR